jgi:hypothetical protein
MTSSTSSFLGVIVGQLFPTVLQNYRTALEEVAASCPDIAGYLEPFYGRAAYVIPQLLFQGGYKALTGVEPSETVQKRGVPFSVICLSLAIADDILDEESKAFTAKMQLGCSAIALIDYAYTAIALDTDRDYRDILRTSVTQLIGAVVKAGQAELDYVQRGDFSVERYLDLARMKTTCYTRHSLRLASRLAAATADQNTCMDHIGVYLGTFIQLVDDCLDASMDTAEGRNGSSYPAILKSSGASIHPVLEIAYKELSSAAQLTTQLPYPGEFVRLLKMLSDVTDLYFGSAQRS